MNKLTCTGRYPDQSQLYENTDEVQEAEQLFKIWYMGQLHKSTSEVQVQVELYCSSGLYWVIILFTRTRD